MRRDGYWITFVINYERTPMATIDEQLQTMDDAALGQIPDALDTVEPRRASPGPMLHDVWRQDDNGHLQLVAAAVEVKARGEAGRQEAIVKGTADLPADDPHRYGSFRTVKHGEMSDPIMRENETVTRDKWS
jgi:hypothetical protein